MRHQELDDTNLNQDQMLSGKVTRLVPGGYGYVEDKNSHKTYIFSFDAIKNYRGETPQQLGLRKGRTVIFQNDGDRITSLDLK